MTRIRKKDREMMGIPMEDMLPNRPSAEQLEPALDIR